MNRHGLQHQHADFFAFQIIYSAGWSALSGGTARRRWHSSTGSGSPRRQEARKGMVNGCQTSVASGDAILPLRFEVLQKGKNISNPQVLGVPRDRPRHTHDVPPKSAIAKRTCRGNSRTVRGLSPRVRGRCCAKNARSAVANLVGHGVIDDLLAKHRGIAKLLSGCGTAR